MGDSTTSQSASQFEASCATSPGSSPTDLRKPATPKSRGPAGIADSGPPFGKSASDLFWESGPMLFILAALNIYTSDASRAVRHRRLALTALGIATLTLECFLEEDSAYIWRRTFEVGRETISHPNGLSKYASWMQMVYYANLKNEPQRPRREAALEKLRAHLSDDMLSKYYEREKIRDSQSTLGERVAFKWYNLWSSAETRAAIDDVMERYRTEMPEAFTRIPECDRRHFVTYTGSVLEYKLLARDHQFVGLSLLYGSIIAAIVCSAPWAFRTAAAVGLGSAVWHLGEVVRYNQFLDGPFRYAHPQDSVQLAVFWQDWTYLNALRLRQQAAINRENRRGSKVARALAAVPWPGNVTQALWMGAFGGLMGSLDEKLRTKWD